MIACFAFTARDEAREGRRAQHKHTIPKTRHDASPSRALPSRHVGNLSLRGPRRPAQEHNIKTGTSRALPLRHAGILAQRATKPALLLARSPSPHPCSRTHRCLHPCSSISTDSRAHSLARCPSPVISRHLSRPSRSLPKLFIFALSRNFSPRRFGD